MTGYYAQMNIYLVGGAVRDELLGYPYHEHDWVVVGATPEQLVATGYQPVGKDFPVFLHPETHEEYALARTERKHGHGYGGFSFYTEPDVTLEQDLARRDLTINAMARDDQGTLIDPYGGRQDLEARILRHVSPAFAEDPLRVLRVARFAARYHHLGFTLAPETLALMHQLVDEDEMEHLVAERVWKETSRALLEHDPDIFFTLLREVGALARLMPELDALFGVPQPPQHHPEVDTGIHTMMVLQQAARLSDELVVRFAALLHDLGKGVTPPEQWPRHIGHEQRGLPLIRTFCERLNVPKDCRDLALLVAEFHTHIHRALELKASTLLKVFQRADLFRRPERLNQILLACKADSRGRPGHEENPYPQADFVHEAFQRCRTVDVKALREKGYEGQALGRQIDRERLRQLRQFQRHTKDQAEDPAHD